MNLDKGQLSRNVREALTAQDWSVILTVSLSLLLLAAIICFWLTVRSKNDDRKGYGRSSRQYYTRRYDTKRRGGVAL